MLRTLLDDEQATTPVLDVYMNLAESEVIRRAYPFGDGTETLPAKYDVLSVQIAQALYLKAGAEGEVSHDENSISRSYANDGIPQSLISQIIPYGATF